jgi:hypothetical protein
MIRPTLTLSTLVLAFLLPLGQRHATAADAAAIPVSPGDWRTGAQLADTCPIYGPPRVASAISPRCCRGLDGSSATWSLSSS